MGVIRGLVSGLALAGIVTFAYEQQLYSTSGYLRSALDSLSKDFESLKRRESIQEAPRRPVNVEKLPFEEAVKYQWNDQLLRGMNALYTTDWANVASRAYSGAKAEASAMKDRFEQMNAPVAGLSLLSDASSQEKVLHLSVVSIGYIAYQVDGLHYISDFPASIKQVKFYKPDAAERPTLERHTISQVWSYST